MGAGVKITAAAVVAVLGLLGGVFVTSTASADCGASVDPGAAAGSGTIAGYKGEQLMNAAQIMNAATALGMDARAQTIGIMTAMGESSLFVLDHGDTAGPDSRGLFQQRDSWGSLADRMDPFKSATLFFQRLAEVDGWQAMRPTEAAHAVQINADPNHYTRWYPAAAEVVQSLSSTGAGCQVSGDQLTLAQELVTAADAGQLRGLLPDHIKEIRWIAQGKTVPDCGIDVRTLQIIVLALRTFEQIGVSDINRKCTGQIEGGGTSSSHWINGGGGAVDFYSLGGSSVTGADGQSVRLISMLEPLMPAGARVGQSQCRASAGTTISLSNFSEFSDSCNHLHIDVAYAKGPLKISG